MFTKQCVVTLDLEGVLAPEIWIAVAEKTGIKDLQELEAEGKNLEVVCDFCRTPYQITVEDLRAIINERKK